MAGFTKRAQILFMPEEYEVLEKIARSEKSSVSEIVRKAVETQYSLCPHEDRKKAVERIIKRHDFKIKDWEEEEVRIMKHWTDKQ